MCLHHIYLNAHATVFNNYVQDYVHVSIEIVEMTAVIFLLAG